MIQGRLYGCLVFVREVKFPIDDDRVLYGVGKW